MINGNYIKAVMGLAALEQIPPLIRDTLIEDTEFLEEYEIETDAIISIVEIGISFQRSELYNCIRNILSGELKGELFDKSGHKWDLADISIDGELPRLELSNHSNRVILPYLEILSPNEPIRLRCLDEIFSTVNLTSNIREKWMKILSERALEDCEVDILIREIHDTPIKQVQSIRSKILSGHCNLCDLVPNSLRYFERLVGVFDGSASINDYAAGVGRSFFEKLSTWRPYEGFLLSLLLSSHSALTNEIKIDLLNSEELVRAFNFLEKQGDRLSQLGAIEVGLHVIHKAPELEPILIRLIEQINDESVDEQNCGFYVLSNLFILVDGELSRISLFSSVPPFYRRLASLSHAALIHRQLINSGININSFCEWAFNIRAQQFYLQSLVDMRSEPRWNPDFVSPSQLKAEFLGRIIEACINNKQNIKEGRLSELISKVISKNQFPSSEFILPGPLEGTECIEYNLPKEISEAIEIQLSKEVVEPLSFTALINSARICFVGFEYAKLAAKVIKCSNYELANITDRNHLFSILNGLASTAAVCRSRELADELRILTRRYRRESQYTLSIDESIRICLQAASSRQNLNEWTNFVGDWLTEFAFGDLRDDDSEVLYNFIRCLCDIVPELWISCGRAVAALTLYNELIC